METKSQEFIELAGKIDAIWVLIAAALVFLMQAGFKCLEVGLVRKKHIEAVAMKNVIDWAVASLIFLVFGFGLMFGKDSVGVIGSNLFFLSNLESVEDGNSLGIIFFMFQLAFAGTALTIVSGAMSERTGFVPYLVASVFIALLIYPVFGHWAWGNLFFADNKSWLADLGFIDFAGSTVVHSVGAWVSLAGLSLLGPRIGRYNLDGSPRDIKAFNIPYAALGLFMLWLGWWGFNGGSTLAFDSSVGLIILNTNIAGATGAIVAYFHCKLFQNKVGIYEKLIGGALGGLVAITASPHIQTPFTSMVIGILAGVVHNYGFEYLVKKRIDDAVGAIPVHGFCGVLGTLLVVISPEILFTDGTFNFMRVITQLGVQALGVAICFGWAFSVGLLMFYTLKKTVGLRVSPDEEREGITLFPKIKEKDEQIDEDELKKLLSEF
ncbi:ammonium transporter [Chondrinema litorale]|uniref:ammonium transporter n=1 Tax=Chondrinema litorale TaxID=2994555 RepID=UPI002543422D|nr:ammonium transporter [Chondrinema litorale]UZR99052.1 ammonium transporter [Chondrinema litorale]